MTRALRKRVRQLQSLLRPLGAADDRQPPPDAVQLARAAGITPDDWQAGVLRSTARRMLLLCSRQAGKSCVAALLALHQALYSPGSLTLLLSPVERQSGELYRSHLRRYYQALGRPVATVEETALTMTLANGSRVVALPGKEANVRCYSAVNLLVIDEAARVPDDLYHSVRPMLAVSRGQLVALSTPWGKRGWFYEEFTGAAPWERVKITAEQCPRIAPEFLEEERRSKGLRWYRQEYLCSFEDTVDAVFASSEIAAALVDGEPLYAGGMP
jgi:hypothetical protein